MDEDAGMGGASPDPLLDLSHIHGDVEGHLASVGEIFTRFHGHDSGCQSWGVGVAGRRYFVKASMSARAVQSLRRAIALHRAVAHETIIGLLHATETDAGLVLVYPWAKGEVLYGGAAPRASQHDHPENALARFQALPQPEVLSALDAIFDAHVAMASAGFVAVDLYDGCFLYDFTIRRMRLCDLDEYRLGAFVVEADRLPGSKRFMAPEEYQRGAVIDQRTTVFNLARTALVLFADGTLEGTFRGSVGARRVLERATRPDPTERYPTVMEFVGAWRRALLVDDGNPDEVRM